MGYFNEYLGRCLKKEKFRHFWDLENFWMATHFVAVFGEGNYTLTTEYNIFWDLQKFWMTRCDTLKISRFLGLRKFLDGHTFCGGLL